MISAIRPLTNKLTSAIGSFFLWLGFNANSMTAISAVLALLAAFAIYYEWFILAAFLVFLSHGADTLDGAIARLTGKVSLFGGYVDSMLDRYCDAVVIIAIGLVINTTTGWLITSAALFGALVTSYAKARVALDKPTDNHGWPSLMERPERTTWIISTLVIVGFLQFIGIDMIPIGDKLYDPLLLSMTVFAVLTNATVIQRMYQAYYVLEKGIQPMELAAMKKAKKNEGKSSEEKKYKVSCKKSTNPLPGKS